jgi:hypothetical protein
MLRLQVPCVALLLIPFALTRSAAVRADDPKPATSVPKGEVTKYTFDRSKIFPGTVRNYWVYVPKQYNPAQAGLRPRESGRRSV